MQVDIREPSYADVLNFPYWRHRIPLDDGRFTPGMTSPSHWEALGLPEDMSGKSFLDIGAFDGLHSFEAEARGAERVLATDVWDDAEYDDEWWKSLRPGRKGFDLVRNYKDSDVEGRTIPVEDISPETVGTFDVVLAAGLVYHVKEPYSAIENIVSVADDVAVIESALMHEDNSKPYMRFDKTSERSDWWSPNLKCLEEMTRQAGCGQTESFFQDPDQAKHPSVREVVVGETQPVYRDFDLTEEQATVDAGQRATVLAEHEGACRIEYSVTDGEMTNRAAQGWVPGTVLEPVNRQQRTVERALDVLREDGVIELLKRARANLSADGYTSDQTRGVVHGHPS